MQRGCLRARYLNVKAMLWTAFFLDSTRPMRVFIMLSCLVQTVWLLLPGSTLDTPSTLLLRRIFGSDEVMAIFSFSVFLLKLFSESLNTKRIKTVAALATSFWWVFIGTCSLLSRVNSVAGALWLLVGAFAIWILYRNEH